MKKQELVKVLLKTGKDQKEISQLVDQYFDLLEKQGEDPNKIRIPKLNEDILFTLVEGHVTIYSKLR